MWWAAEQPASLSLEPGKKEEDSKRQKWPECRLGEDLPEDAMIIADAEAVPSSEGSPGDSQNEELVLEDSPEYCSFQNEAKRAQTDQI